MRRISNNAALSLLLVLGLPATADARVATGSFFEDVGMEKILEQQASDATVLAPTPTVSNACKLEVLRKLGWRVFRGSTFQASGGNPCLYSSLEEARVQELLQLQISEADSSDLGKKLNDLLYSQASVCAYKFRVSQAVKQATAELADNPLYGFDGSAVNADFPGDQRTVPWKGACYQTVNGSDGKLYSKPTCMTPIGSSARALERFVSGSALADCAAGLQVAEYHTLHRLYGSNAFDRVFDPSEVVVGAWDSILESQSATWGKRDSSGTIWDTDAAQASQVGPRWIEGLSGYIGNVFGEEYLDEPADRGENFITVSVSAAAADQLRRHGSWNVVNDWNRRLFELTTRMPQEIKALIAKDSIDSYRLDPRTRTDLEEARKIIRQPIYTGFKVYVHPLGVRSLDYHVFRLLQRNARTPYRIDFYQSRVNRGLYWRYVQHLMNQCAG